ncbi:DUF362 domain-containing protein [Candidatus Woesearchaeota archaeon]|nr:DUF362 domain-containing protein [Candidatus Woesearchaeota archaeon]
MVRAALVKGAVRYDNIVRALELVSDEFQKAVEKSRKPVIVPEFLYTKNENTVTNVDAVRAVLDAITYFTNKEIKIAGSSFSLADAFSDYHYLQLQDSYSVQFADLFREEFKPVKGAGFMFSKTLLESDCRIVLAMLETHRTLLANLSTSQFVLSGMDFSERKRVMRDPKAAHDAVAGISERVKPEFAIIDGFTGLEGDFPAATKVVRSNVAIAGNDAGAVDSTAASVMGLLPKNIRYLRKKKVKAVKVVGDSVSKCRNNFILPRNSEALIKL